MIDELALLLNRKLRVKVATLSQISDLLKKTETVPARARGSYRGLHPGCSRRPKENSEETLSIDKLTAVDSDIAPVIKLVDTTIFNALERRASDIHIESRDQEVAIKYRIDGVLPMPCHPLPRTGTPLFFRASRS